MNNLDFQYKSKGLDVSFRVLTKIPPQGICGWDFGDEGVSYNNRSPLHSYNEPGIYTVTLTIDTPQDGTWGQRQMLIFVSDKVKTHLSDSIYNLINAYIPKEISEGMTNEQKSLYINKWQLYIQPLVNRPRGEEIPVEEYNNELYYTGLENQLIMELAAWEYLNVTLSNLLIGVGYYIQHTTTVSSTKPSGGSGDDESTEVRDRVRKITTGPTEVEYFDTLTESASSLFRSFASALQPGGIMDELRKNLCMLSQRLSIYLPFCEQPYHPVIPRVVNRRNPGPLGGPNPTAPLNNPVVTLIPER